MLCLLCNLRDANASGSHIIPHFIIASGVSDGSTARDLEQSFRLDAEGSDFYFGRSVLPEALEDTLGRPVSDEEIESNEHHYVRDNIYCQQCEDDLANLESLYKECVSPTLLRRDLLTDNQKKILYCFWLLVILRCSVSNFNEFRLDLSIERSLYNKLEPILHSPQSFLEEECLAKPIVENLFVGYMGEQEDATRNFTVLNPFRRIPHVFIINNYAIVFDCQSINDLQESINEIGVVNPVLYEEGLIVQYLSEESRDSIIRYCANITAKQFILKTKSSFEEAYLSSKQTAPSPQIISHFFTELLDDSISVAVKFSAIRVRELIQKHT